MTTRFVLTLPGALNPHQRVGWAREYLAALVRVDRMLLREGMVPPLYQTDVRYRQEPAGQPYEEFADALTCLERGWGDCDDLSAWRVADLLEQGVDASLLFDAAPVAPGKRRLVHCLVRLPANGREDPSRIMAKRERDWKR
jgi:hypothetical protein